MTSPIELHSSLLVGTVESVSPDQIRVKLDGQAPQATSLNTGTPTPFPRVNSYVLMPNECGATVAYIGWIGSEYAPFLRSQGSREQGLIDLPFPMRKMSVSPVGTLITERASNTRKRYALKRGVLAFPCVGDQVIMPTPEQLDAIVGGKETDRRVQIGTSPLATNTPIRVDPDKLFGRHLAVLGNTGSGKSCSVAGLVRWSLESATTEITANGENSIPNARFIVLDPNGEYSKAFVDLKPRRFQVDGSDDFERLKIPAWLWNGEEWAAFTGAAPGVQRPILLDALRRLRSEEVSPDPFRNKVRYRIRNYRQRVQLILKEGRYLGFPHNKNCADAIIKMKASFESLHAEAENGALKEGLDVVINAANTAETQARDFVHNGEQRYGDFTSANIEGLLEAMTALAASEGMKEDGPVVGEDIPKFFSAKELPDFVEALGNAVPGRDISAFIDTLNLRIRGLISTGPLASVVDTGETQTLTLEKWLADFIGSDHEGDSPISVIDLALVPSEALHIVVAVLSRMIFEAIQRYRRMNAKQLPTVLVLDEAHTFAHKSFGYDGASPAARSCCRTFERIAREGRKFGLGMVLASQRPSEMSPTVLSQCNSFLLHRIVNDEDQNLVARLVPDNVRGLLRELPSLPSQHAILLGWATPIPILVEMGDLDKRLQPQSDDPDFWDVWTRKKDRAIDWGNVANDWTGTTEDADSTNS